MARIVALIVAAALAGAPAAAAAASTTPAPAPQQAPVTTQSGSISRTQGILIAVAVVALIGGIWIAISRDARRATGGRVRTADAEPGGRGGSATRAARRSRRLSAEERRRRKRGRAP